MIELKNVDKIYLAQNKRIQALNNITLHVPQGVIFGVIGASGAGKSTLIRCVNLLERPTSGQVWVGGQELTRLDEPALRLARRHMGMIFQHFNLLPSRTVYQNIALPLDLAHTNHQQIRQAITPLMELTGLLDKADSYPAQLSGGQKQRVAIARALACQPKVLLCDEATSALDPQTTHTILQLLKSINQQLGLTILLITHEIEVVKLICDHVALVAHGQLIEQADLLSFFTQARSPLAKAFIKTALHQDLPTKLQTRLQTEKTSGSHAVLRIHFHGLSAAEPLTAHLIRTIGLHLNILQANIEFIKEVSVGTLVAEVLGEQTAIESGIDYLNTKGAYAEIIAYVDRAIV